jgi:hypothetical protein
MARTLSLGMTGTGVRDLQAALKLRTPNSTHTPSGDSRPPWSATGFWVADRRASKSSSVSMIWSTTGSSAI